MNSIKRSFLIGIGTLSIALGVIGIFLPVMPTTPFLILAGACYMRSSKKLYNQLIENKWIGHYLRNYYDKRGIPLHAKVVSISFLWLTMGISMFFFVKFLWMRITLVSIGAGITVFLLSQKTLKSDSNKNEKNNQVTLKKINNNIDF